jgi:hypothetical protein
VRLTTDRWQYGCTHEAELAGRYIQDEDVTKMPPCVAPHAADHGIQGFFTASGYPGKASACMPQTPAHAQ